MKALNDIEVTPYQAAFGVSMALALPSSFLVGRGLTMGITWTRPFLIEQMIVPAIITGMADYLALGLGEEEPEDRLKKLGPQLMLPESTR